MREHRPRWGRRVMLDREKPIVRERTAALLASLPGLLVGFEAGAAWAHAPVGHWLARTKSFWRLAGQGPAFEEMRRLIPRAGSSYELCADSSAHIDLLVLDGELSSEQECPAHWTASLAPDAVVMIAGIHPAAGASVLWRCWCDAQPAPAVFRVAAGNGLGILMPAPQCGPVAVRELCEADPDVAALFDALQLAVEQSRSAFCDAEAIRAREVASTRRLSRERARADALARQIVLLESSAAYRTALVLRRAASRLPPGLRTLIRRVVKVAWWTVSGQLLVAVRARRELLRRNAAAAVGSVPPPVVSSMCRVNKSEVKQF
jgi:hypothetical protein